MKRTFGRTGRLDLSAIAPAANDPSRSNDLLGFLLIAVGLLAVAMVIALVTYLVTR